MVQTRLQKTEKSNDTRYLTSSRVVAGARMNGVSLVQTLGGRECYPFAFGLCFMF